MAMQVDEMMLEIDAKYGRGTTVVADKLLRKKLGIGEDACFKVVSEGDESSGKWMLANFLKAYLVYGEECDFGRRTVLYAVEDEDHRAICYEDLRFV